MHGLYVLQQLKGEELTGIAKTLATTTDFAELNNALDALNQHLALRTYLDGHELTVVDWLVWGSIRGMAPQ